MKAEYPFEQFLNDTLFVLVLYEIPIGQSASWLSLIEEVIGVDVFIQDNSEHPQEIIDNQLRIKYIHDVSNPGVSRAYNRAAVYGQALKKKWLIFLDHDTRFPKRWIRTYWECARDHTDEKLFAPILRSGKIISPFKYSTIRGKHISQINSGSISLSTHFVINSGLMIQGDLFAEAGGYDELIPLDFSDFAFLHRIKLFHSDVFIVPLEVTHHISFNEKDSREKRILRFKSYCKGAKEMKKYGSGVLLIFILTLGRALKMSFQNSTPRFIIDFLKIWATE